MPRNPRLAVLAIGLACLAALLVVPALPAAPPADVPAAAPAQGAAPSLVVPLFGSRLTYAALPRELVLAELEHEDGSKVSGEGLGDATGTANVFFFAFDVGVSDPVIRPGDRITLARLNQRPIKVTVPRLTADVDVAADRVLGTAPAGASLEVAIRYGRPAVTVTRTVAADPAGRFAVDLAPLDLPPGATDGEVTYDSPNGHRFVARFAATRAELTVGAGEIRGRSTPGSAVQVAIGRPGVGEIVARLEAVDDGSWTANRGNVVGDSPQSGMRLAAGDVVTLTIAGGPLGAPRVFAVTTPDVRLALDPAANRVSGRAPVGARLAVQASSLGGESADAAATAGGDGAFEADLGAGVRLGPGWRVRADLQVAPEIRVGRLAVIPQALIGVHTATVRGLAEPGGRITVTLRTPAGPTTGVAVAGAQGDFAVMLGGFMPDAQPEIVPGSEIEVAYVAGDPLVAQVPALTARSDDAGDYVEGTAPPGAEVRVAIREQPDAPVVTVAASGRGDYRASFAGSFDLRRPMDGTVMVQPDRPLAFYTTWSAIQLNVQLSGNITFVLANGAPGRSYTARVVAPDGQVVGVTSGRIYDLTGAAEGAVLIGSGGFFYLLFTDVAGDLVPVQAGDRIEITAGDDTASLTVPRLEATVFVERDVIAGRTTPGQPVVIIVQPPSGSPQTAVAMASDAGTFSHDFSGELDLKYNDQVQLMASVDGHVVMSYITSPGLTLDLDEGLLVGVLPLDPGTRLSVSVRRGTEAIYDAPAQVYTGGQFVARIVGDDDLPLPLREGDVLTVLPTDPPGEPVTMDVPELTIEADIATDVIGGRATPGGTLVLLAMHTTVRASAFPIGQAWPAIGTDGRWTAETVPSHDVRPGSQIQARYSVPAGHVATRMRIVPQLGVEHAGPNVCGVSQPRRPVSASLIDVAGSRLVQASSVAESDGRYQMVWRLGETLIGTAPGQSVRARLAELDAEVVVPELAVKADWERSRVTVRAAPDTEYYVNYPAARCLDRSTDLTAVSFIAFGRTDEEGRFEVDTVPIAPGEGLEIDMDTPSGHRIFKQVYRLKGRAYIDRDRVGGVTGAGMPVTARLLDASGRVRASTYTDADVNGRFDTRFEGAETIHAGDAISITAGADRATFEVEYLGFDWSPGDQIVGQAPAGRTVTLGLRLSYGRVLEVPVAVAADGTFRFGPTDVPPRATWTWDQVTAVRAVLTTAGGHEIVFQTDDFDGGEQPPDREVYLPVAYRGYAGTPATTLGRPAVGDAGTESPGTWAAARRPVAGRSEAAGAAASPAVGMNRAAWLQAGPPVGSPQGRAGRALAPAGGPSPAELAGLAARWAAVREWGVEAGSAIRR